MAFLEAADNIAQLKKLLSYLKRTIGDRERAFGLTALLRAGTSILGPA
jgi:hypothetical protein